MMKSGLPGRLKVARVSVIATRPRAKRPIWWITVEDLKGETETVQARDLRRRQPREYFLPEPTIPKHLRGLDWATRP